MTAGLLFVPQARDVKLQPDFCVKPISGPWWDLAVINPSSESCPSGYTFDPAS